MSKIAVVILNWNGAALMQQYLPSVVKYSSIPDVEIIIADNASKDNSISFLQTLYPSIKIIPLTENFGFAGGYNKALEQVNAEYYILLNSDVEVTENWIMPVINEMEKDKTIAAAMPKIKSFHNRNHFEHAGAAGGFIDKYGFPFCQGRIFDQIEEDKEQYNSIKSIFWASGACMFIRSNIFKKAGGFDTDFFAHMEEIDLCWRIKNLGYQIFYIPKATVYHLGGGMLPYNNPRKIFLNFRNNLFTLYKNVDSSRFPAIIIQRMAFDFLAAINFIIHGEIKNFYSVFNAHMAFYSQLKNLKKKRKLLIIQNNTAVNHKEIYPKSIVASFWLKRKKKYSDLNFL